MVNCIGWRLVCICPSLHEVLSMYTILYTTSISMASLISINYTLLQHNILYIKSESIDTLYNPHFCDCVLVRVHVVRYMTPAVRLCLLMATSGSSLRLDWNMSFFRGLRRIILSSHFWAFDRAGWVISIDRHL